ncbi:hypothetical protein B6U90_06465 [Thermoplasmatales archaeon ex4484_6]|nr:MAG: hypothetical protein B6U90_06465 [Thermoplasmatales archaeon ex4484_6]
MISSLIERLAEYLASVVASHPMVYWGSILGSSILVGIVFLLIPRRRKRKMRIRPTYHPVELPLEEPRIADESSLKTFRDVGVCGRMSIAEDVQVSPSSE